jgi:hypothetical protein
VIKSIFRAIALTIALASAAHAQSLPAGSIGSVVNPVANNSVLYSFSYTASTTGANYVGFAFRQDPAFWNFTDPGITAAGSSTNLFVNGNLSSGGAVQVTTNGGTQTIQAPANWGVWYQNGTYPAAAGTWSGSSWYDGAVGSYDGIYQGVNLTSGTVYTISFYALSTAQAGSNDAAMIGVYAGLCTSVSLSAADCVPAASSFTPIAVPAQTVNAGNPSAPPMPDPSSAPTVVSTAATTPITVVDPAVAHSNLATTVLQVVDARANTGSSATITRTITPLITTPTTITTHYTPQIIQTWSDNSTTVVTDPNNPAYDVIVAGTPIHSTGTVTQSSASWTSNGLSNAVAQRNTNPFLVDILSQRDGSWISPSASYTKTVGSMASGGVSLGYQKTVENNTVGIAFNYNNAKSSGLTNNSITVDNYAATAYILSRQTDAWFKAQIGSGVSNYTGSVSLPQFVLYNNEKFRQTNFYADLGVYGAIAVHGFRPLLGATIITSSIGADQTSGSTLLNSAPQQGRTTEINPYVGVRYEFSDDVGVETRVTQTKDFSTVVGVRAVAQTEIRKNVFLNASAGFDKGRDYTGAVGTIGLKIAF